MTKPALWAPKGSVSRTHSSPSRRLRCSGVSLSFGSRILVESKNDQVMLRILMGRRTSGDNVAFLDVVTI
jgi:hypothetical protein